MRFHWRLSLPVLALMLGSISLTLRAQTTPTPTPTEPEPQKAQPAATSPATPAAEPDKPEEPNFAKTAKITCSDKESARAKARPQVNGRAAKDGREPKSSHDNSPLSHFDWWPDRDVTHWCEYAWEEPVKISQTQLYWWDDSQHGGGCKPPVSWKAFYKVGEEWKPVETKDTFGVEDDKYNKVEFSPVETRGLRLEIVAPKDGSVGIQEWKVR
jgi:uncharacterized protein